MTHRPVEPPHPVVKVIIVGNAGIGKTCLISSFFKQPFDFQTNPTVAPAYSCADINRSDGTKVSLQIWDTAGQERYHSISKLFYRDCDVALICYHPGDEKSVDSIPEWLARVRDEVPDVKTLLILTKADLLPESQMEQLKMEASRMVVDHEIDKYYVTSAINMKGVSAVFQAAAEMCPIRAPSYPSPSVSEQDKQTGCC